MKSRPLHKPDDCEAICQDGRLCALWGMWKMIKIDGSFQLLCTCHMNIRREEYEAHPELFNPLRFVTVASGDLAANKSRDINEILRETPGRRR